MAPITQAESWFYDPEWQLHMNGCSHSKAVQERVTNWKVEEVQQAYSNNRLQPQAPLNACILTDTQATRAIRATRSTGAATNITTSVANTNTAVDATHLPLRRFSYLHPRKPPPLPLQLSAPSLSIDNLALLNRLTSPFQAPIVITSSSSMFASAGSDSIAGEGSQVPSEHGSAKESNVAALAMAVAEMTRAVVDVGYLGKDRSMLHADADAKETEELGSVILPHHEEIKASVCGRTEAKGGSFLKADANVDPRHARTVKDDDEWEWQSVEGGDRGWVEVGVREYGTKGAGKEGGLQRWEQVRRRGRGWVEVSGEDREWVRVGPWIPRREGWVVF